MTIPEMLLRVKSINLDTQIPIIISNTSGEMVRLNKEQLYLRGENSKGVSIKNYAPYRSTQYALDKNRLNPSPGLFNPDLKLTGAFQNAMFAQIKGGKSVLFGSSDFKTPELEKKYSKEIFGLTFNSKRVYLDNTVMPEVRRYITGLTGLKFR